MDFYRLIENLEDKEIDKIVKKRIAKLEEESKRDNPNTPTIGYMVDYNPEDYHLLEKKKFNSFGVNIRHYHFGYIHQGTKIVYGMTYNNLGQARNSGMYYYMDDTSYLYDFCHFIKDKEVSNEYELMEYVLDFLQMYFGVIKMRDRDDMNQMIYKNEYLYQAPYRKHSITDFKGQGNAMCSEYSVLAQNILSLFGFDMFLVIGREKTITEDSHAFNLISFIEEETQEEVNALIDYSNYVKVFDRDFHTIGRSPFIANLPDVNEEFAREFLWDEKHLVFEDYAYYILGDQMSRLGYDRKRDYYVNNTIMPEMSVKKSKILRS